MSKYIYSFGDTTSAIGLREYDDCIPIHSSIVPVNIALYELDDYPEEEIEEPIGERIGFVSGFLVLGRELDNMIPSDVTDRDAYMNLICDDINADLGYVISALLEDNGPLCVERTIFGADHFYIDEVIVHDDHLRDIVLDALPRLIFMHLHVYPDIMSYYPVPLPHEKKKTKAEEFFEEAARRTQLAIAEQHYSGKNGAL